MKQSSHTTHWQQAASAQSAIPTVTRAQLHHKLQPTSHHRHHLCSRHTRIPGQRPDLGRTPTGANTTLDLVGVLAPMSQLSVWLHGLATQNTHVMDPCHQHGQDSGDEAHECRDTPYRGSCSAAPRERLETVWKGAIQEWSRRRQHSRGGCGGRGLLSGGAWSLVNRESEPRDMGGTIQSHLSLDPLACLLQAMVARLW